MNNKKRNISMSLGFVLVCSVVIALSVIRPIALSDKLSLESNPSVGSSKVIVENVATGKISITGTKSETYASTIANVALTSEQESVKELPIAELIAGAFAISAILFLIYLIKFRKKQDKQ